MVLCKLCATPADEVFSTYAEIDKEYKGVHYQQYAVIERTFVHYRGGMKVTCLEVPPAPMILQSVPKSAARELVIPGVSTRGA